jgi:hypothetical protein
MAEGYSPYLLQGLKDVFCVILNGEVVGAAEDYCPVVGIMRVRFYNCIGFQIRDEQRFFLSEIASLYSHAFSMRGRKFPGGEVA